MVVPKRELLSVTGSKKEICFFHTSSTTNFLEFLDTLSFRQTLFIYSTVFSLVGGALYFTLFVYFA